MEGKVCRIKNEEAWQFLRKPSERSEDSQATASQDFWALPGELPGMQRRALAWVGSAGTSRSWQQWQQFPGTTKAPTATSAQVLPAQDPAPLQPGPPAPSQAPEERPSARGLHTKQGPLLSPVPSYCSSCARLQVLGWARERPGPLTTARSLPAQPSGRHVVFPSPWQPRRLRLRPRPRGGAAPPAARGTRRRSAASRPAGRTWRMRSGQHAGAAALLAPPLLTEFAQLGRAGAGWWARCVCSGVEAAPRRGRGWWAGACPAAGEVEGLLGHGASGGLMCLYLHARLGFCGAVLPAPSAAGLSRGGGVGPCLGEGLRCAGLGLSRRVLHKTTSGIGGPGWCRGIYSAPESWGLSAVIAWSPVAPVCHCR